MFYRTKLGRLKKRSVLIIHFGSLHQQRGLDRTKRRASDLDNTRAHNVVGTKQLHLTVHLMQTHNKTITCAINYYKTLWYTKSQLTVYNF